MAECGVKDWFVPAVKISNDKKIVVLDDDESIHQVWDAKLSQANIASDKVLHFLNENDFRKWIIDVNDIDRYLFLCDYELVGTNITGLDLIEEYGISSQSILVTSRYEEDAVFIRAKKLGIRMMPKSLAHIIPVFHFVKKQVALRSDVDAVIIDDDMIVHQNWKRHGELNNKKYLIVKDENEFWENADRVSFATPIYLDVNLGNNISGIDVAKRLHDAGFLNLSLATGYGAQELQVPDFIKSVIGKMQIR